MVTAFVLVIADIGAEKRIVEELSDLDFVEEADILYGEYDIIAKVKIDEVSKLSDFVLEKIRSIQGVKRTSTLIVA